MHWFNFYEGNSVKEIWSREKTSKYYDDGDPGWFLEGILCRFWTPVKRSILRFRGTSYHLVKEVLFLMHQRNRNWHYSLEKHSKLFLPEDINGLDFCTSCSNKQIFLFHQSCTGTNFLISSNVEFPVSMTSGGWLHQIASF